MNAIPGLNEKRRLTSVTQIDMTIIEPAGITLFERLRAAAANNNYLDHIDAPYLLTVEFTGFDEVGKVLSAAAKEKHEEGDTHKDDDRCRWRSTRAGLCTRSRQYPTTNSHTWTDTTGSGHQDHCTRDTDTEHSVVELEQLLNEQNKDDIGQRRDTRPVRDIHRRILQS